MVRVQLHIGQWVVRNFTVHCLLCLIFVVVAVLFFPLFFFFNFISLLSFLLHYPYPNLWILFNFLPHHTVGVGSEQTSVWHSAVCWAKTVKYILLSVCWQIKIWDSLGFQEPRKWVHLKQTLISWLNQKDWTTLKSPDLGFSRSFEASWCKFAVDLKIIWLKTIT